MNGSMQATSNIYLCKFRKTYMNIPTMPFFELSDLEFIDILMYMASKKGTNWRQVLEILMGICYTDTVFIRLEFDYFKV